MQHKIGGVKALSNTFKNKIKAGWVGCRYELQYEYNLITAGIKVVTDLVKYGK